MGDKALGQEGAGLVGGLYWVPHGWWAWRVRGERWVRKLNRRVSSFPGTLQGLLSILNFILRTVRSC